jgi:DNA-binding transcriptional ArsR family regulator
MSDQPTVDIVFDALGDPVRRTILELLTDGPQPVGEMAGRLPVGRPAVSKHLRVLSDAGLVRHDRAGTRNLYALAPAGMVTAQEWLVTTWDTALSAYAAAVRDATGQPRTGVTSGSPHPGLPDREQLAGTEAEDG